MSRLWASFGLLVFLAGSLNFTHFAATSGHRAGKPVLRLRVVDPPAGRRPDVAHSAIRHVLGIVDWRPAFYLVGAIVALVTTQKRRLGDVLAETVVGSA